MIEPKKHRKILEIIIFYIRIFSMNTKISWFSSLNSLTFIFLHLFLFGRRGPGLLKVFNEIKIKFGL